MNSALTIHPDDQIVIIERPRVRSLLERAAGHGLVTVVAGTGYGKTNAVLDFVRAACKGGRARVVWTRVSRLDDAPARFWRRFVVSAGKASKEYAEAAEGLGFPDSASKATEFIRITRKEAEKRVGPGGAAGGADAENGGRLGAQGVDGGRRAPMLFLVFDDYVCRECAEVDGLLERVVDARVPNLCLILISRAQVGVGLEAARGGGLFQITARDLAFTEAEAAELFRARGVEARPSWLREVEGYTGGWPVALYQMCGGPGTGVEPTRPATVDALFEKDYYSAYDPGFARLLTALSLVSDFSFDTVRAFLGRAAKDVSTAILEHPFIDYDGEAKRFRFHNMYRSFLADKAFLLEDGEKAKLLKAAGETYYAAGRFADAIDCFSQAGLHERALGAIRDCFGRSLAVGLAEQESSYRALLALPEAFRKQRPLVGYLWARVYMNRLEPDRVAAELDALEARLSEGERGDAGLLLGEVCFLRAAWLYNKGKDSFLDYLKRAAELLDTGPSLRAPRLMCVGNNSVLRAEDGVPGSMRRMERANRESMALAARTTRGGGKGSGTLFSAEANYACFDVAGAKRAAFGAIYEAMEEEQYDVVCNARWILAKVALIAGDYKEFKAQVLAERDFIESRQLEPLYNMRDCLMAIYYIKLRDFERVPVWIAGLNERVYKMAPLERGRERLLLAHYLLGQEKFEELLALTDRLEDFSRRAGYWLDTVSTLVMRAVGCMKLRDEPAALASLRDAYDMAQPNEVVSPFVELGNHMRALADCARRAPRAGFDAGWLDAVYRKSSTYAKKLSAVIKDYQIENEPAGGAGVKLSRRELEVLNHLAQGLTRKDIADANRISENTAKSTITNVYNKLGAVNRADAIRIAATLGIIH